MADKTSTGSGFKELFKGVADQVAHDLVNLPLDAVREAVGVEKESGKRVGGNDSNTTVELANAGVIESSKADRDGDNKKSDNYESQINKNDSNNKDGQSPDQSNSQESSDSNNKSYNNDNDNTTHEHKDIQSQNSNNNRTVTDDDDDDVKITGLNLTSSGSSNRGDVMRFIYDGLSQKQQAVVAKELGRAREEEETKRIDRIRGSLGIQSIEVKKKEQKKIDIIESLEKAVWFGFDQINLNG